MNSFIELALALWRRHAAALTWLVPALVLLVSAAVALRIASWEAPTFAASLASLSSAPGGPEPTAPNPGVIPPTALTATLWDELFPAPLPPPETPPPPKLDLELIAVVLSAKGADDGAISRRAVVFSKARSDLFELAIGETLPGRPDVTLVSLRDRGATFDVGGRPVTLELQP
ncbi:MAG: hypothetical protein IBJ10_08135 [Phycisphaerales bacterium]|nr:hypothetical protein [Phycisphaerales bacterium]